MKEKKILKFRFIFSVIFFLLPALIPSIHSQEKQKTGQAFGESKIIAFDYVKGRDNAILSAQKRILEKELLTILSNQAYSYFSKTIEKKLLDNAPGFFLFISILDEQKEKNRFTVSLQGKYDVDLLNRSLEQLGLPNNKTRDTAKAGLVEVKSGKYDIKRHFKYLGIDLVKQLRQPVKLTGKRADEIFEENSRIQVLYQIEAEETDDNVSRYTVETFIKSRQKPISRFSFEIKPRDDTNPQNLDPIEQLTEYLNQRTLKQQTIAELVSNRQTLEVTGFKSVAEKLFFTDYIISKKGLNFFESAIPKTFTKDTVILSIKTTDPKTWIRQLNSGNRQFELILTSSDSKYLYAQYKSRVRISVGDVELKANAAGISYHSENEPNNSLYQFDTAAAGVAVYGSLGDQTDTDVYRVSGQTFKKLEFKNTNKTDKDVSIVILDKDQQWYKKIVIDKNTRNLMLEMPLQDLDETLYLIISENSESRQINYGRQKNIEYMFRIEEE